VRSNSPSSRTSRPSISGRRTIISNTLGSVGDSRIASTPASNSSIVKCFTASLNFSFENPYHM